MQNRKRSIYAYPVCFLTLTVILTFAIPKAFASIDTDESRTDPVPHRFIHGTLGDANFQICLPEIWNGKIIISTRGFSGDEYSNDGFKQIILPKGYVYAASDEGWNRYTIVDSPEDKYFESRRRIVQLTNFARGVLQQNYRQKASRTYIFGASNGGHHTKWLVEDYPSLYDGGLSMFGYNSALEVFRAMPNFLRNYDIIEPRIADIIAERAANPDWDPATEPLSPPLSDEQTIALLNMYDLPAHLKNGFVYNVGQEPGSESLWPVFYPAIVAYLMDSLQKFDPTYDPNGDGDISVDEIKGWDPYQSPIHIQNELRKPDLTGNLKRPVLIGQGLLDVLVVPEENRAYKSLVEQTIGLSKAQSLLRVYLVPGMAHSLGGPTIPFVDEALDALDSWVDFVESNGVDGATPGVIMGIDPL